MKSTGKEQPKTDSSTDQNKSTRTTTSSFDGSSSKKKQEAEEKMTKDDNFFFRRHEETEQASRDPRSFRQDQGKALRWVGYTSNVFFVFFMGSLFISIGIFQYIYSAGFGMGLESMVGSHRKNYWTKRNEAVDTKLHQHSSFSDMLGMKQTNVTNSSDDEILARAKAFKEAKDAEKQQHMMLATKK